MSQLLHYKQFGDTKSNQVIFFLHGLLGSLDNWRSQAKHIATQYTVRAITPDIRNHGQSPHLSGMRYKDMAGDVLRLADHLNIDAFDLLGHSMGGKVAMYLALHHPDRLNKLIIVDIAPRPYTLWHLPVFKALLSLPVDRIGSRKQASELLAAHIPDHAERAFLLKNLKMADGGGYEWRCDLQEITRAYLNIANFNSPDHAVFDKPCLFVRGENSPYIDPENDQEIITQLFPQANIQSITNAGHLPHVEAPEAFYHSIESFLKPDPQKRSFV
ncbi:MAG: alpha/beta hydrolase [Proteobacteria bacterium]|nr:MAG: alpha/beta hydrolase [Pseudomonadota bacterium]